MEFKCKNCNSTKYRQISPQVKQCEECGMQIQSKGVVDPKVLDVTEEQEETKQNKEINPKSDFIQTQFNPFNPFIIHKRIRTDGMIEYYTT